MLQSTYAVTVLEPGLEPAFIKFVKKVWPSSGGERKDRVSLSRFEGSSDSKAAPVFLFLKDREVIGHIGTLPVRIWTGSQVCNSHWVVGFMVLPEHRNSLVAPLLLKKVNEVLPLALTLHVEPHVLRIFQGLGWTHVGVIPQFVYPLDGYHLFDELRELLLTSLASSGRWMADCTRLLGSLRITRMVGGSLAWACVRLWDLLAQTATRHIEVFEEKAFEESYDDLWDRVHKKFKAMVVRDRRYLEARFGSTIKDHTLLAFRKKGQLLGFCIIKLKQFVDDPRMGNLRMVTILDCLFDPDDQDTLHRLVQTAVAIAKEQGAHAVVCTASHSAIQACLRKNRFFTLPATLHFAYLDRASVIPATNELQSWHITRADSDAAANF